MIGGLVDYSGEVSLLTSSCWATALVSGVEGGGQLLTGQAASLVKMPDGAEMMKQFERLMEINQRLAQREIEAASVAYQALSNTPNSVFAALPGALAR